MLLTFFRRYGLALLLGCAGAAWAYRALRQAHTEVDLAQLEKGRAQLEAKGYATKLASTELERDQFKSSLEAEKALHGSIIAAAKLHIAARDTMIVHDTLPTTRQTDSTRTAAFQDSTFAGVVKGTVTAPPYPAALGVQLHVERPAFDPEVAFVQTGRVVTAIVQWQGEHVEIPGAFALPQPQSAPRLQRFVEALVQQDGTWTARGGVELRLPLGLSAAIAGQQRLVVGQPFVIQAGIRKVF